MDSLGLQPEKALAPQSRAALEDLAACQRIREDFYLAGSAGLSLYLGHRSWAGLDFMAPANRLTPQKRRDLLGELLALGAETQVETARDGYLYARFGGVNTRFFYYPYPLIAPEEQIAGMAVASLADLGLMKVAAIISRGTRRDFIDLYLLCRHLPLEDLLAVAPNKFGHVRDFPLQALKGLADLSCAEGEPMPRLDLPVDWQEVEDWARREVRRLGRIHVGLPASPDGS